MKAVVTVDNIGSGELKGEWGLSIYVEYGDKKILVDTGASPLFADNAEKLGISLAEVDFAVLSHAHFDHADGMETFFRRNSDAKMYLQESCAENCYAKKWIFSKYVGIPRGVLSAYKDRIEYVSGVYEVCPGVSIVGHSTEGLQEIGRRELMYRRTGLRMEADDFSHEQSLVIDTEKGLVIINCCSHGGVVNIVHEVKRAFPEKTVYAYIGGFHLFRRSDEENAATAREIKAEGLKEIYTGHCTGGKALKVLKNELGDALHTLRVGLVIEI